MQQANSEEFSQLTRQRLMKSIVDFETLVYHTRDILLTDLSSRNTMMVEGGFNLVFLDFAGAIFNRRRDDPVIVKVDLFLGQYVSPLLRSNKTMAMQFNDWIDWDWLAWVGEEYAHTAYTITSGMRDRYTY